MRLSNSTLTVAVAVVLALVLAVSGIYAWRVLVSPPAPGNTPGPGGPGPDQGARLPRETVAQNLDVPWALAFLPGGDLIFTERPGNVKLIKKGSREPKLLKKIGDVAADGEGGLLGVAVHPDYRDNRFVYLYYTYRRGGRTLNKVVRYTLRGGELKEDKVVIDKIPGNVNHNGGRLKFGPDGLLYITAGDSLESGLAQDKGSLAGKILRLEDDGGIPDGNPFPGSPVYSIGHRNPQGLAWDDRGRLWETEHGNSGNDEVNLIEPGKNYGWPAIEDDESSAGMRKPAAQSRGDTWAPSGAAWFDGSLYFAGLRGQALFALNTDDPATPNRIFPNEFGRLREAVLGPDGFIYIATNNRDGRGNPGPGDDRIIKFKPGAVALENERNR